MSNHPQKSGSLCSGMSGSLCSGIGGSLYSGIGGSLYPGIGGSLCPGILRLSKKPGFIKNISAKMARLCHCFMRKNTSKINIIFKPKK